MSEIRHGANLHLERGYVIDGLFENDRERLFSATGNQPAEDSNSALNGGKGFSLEAEDAEAGLLGAGRAERHLVSPVRCLPELELEAVGEDGAAPARPPAGGDGEDSVGGLADGPATAGRVGGDVDTRDCLAELGGIEVLLRVGFPSGVGLGLGGGFLLLWAVRVTRAIGWVWHERGGHLGRC